MKNSCKLETKSNLDAFRPLKTELNWKELVGTEPNRTRFIAVPTLHLFQEVEPSNPNLRVYMYLSSTFSASETLAKLWRDVEKPLELRQTEFGSVQFRSVPTSSIQFRSVQLSLQWPRCIQNF